MDTLFYPIEGGKPVKYGSYNAMIDCLAEDAMPSSWDSWDDRHMDREFQEQDARYGSHEMFLCDDDTIEVVTFDGKIIGTLDEPVPANLSEYVTYEQLQTREAAE
jgi:hypothetical protein